MQVMKKIRNLLLLLAFGAFVVTLPSCHKWLGDDEENGVMLNNLSICMSMGISFRAGS